MNIKSIDQCPDPDQYKYVVNIQRHKVNRTHEAFDGDSNLEIPLDENTGVSMRKKKLYYQSILMKLPKQHHILYSLRFISN